MPKKKKEITDNKPKTLSLFDHVKNVFENQSPDYFKNLTDGDKKTFSNYLICRFISMDFGLIEVIAYLQKYAPLLDKETFYRLCIGFISRGRRFNPYIKCKKEGKFEKWLIELFIKHFEVKKRHALEYLEILSLSGNGRDEIKKICRMYGTDEKQMKELNL